jgi:hypothetical protein
MEEGKWTYSEKKIARRVFDSALQKELTELISAFKRRAQMSATPDDVWAIAESLLEQRREIDQKYDYRYSQLLVVFGRLVREKRIRIDEVEGLSDEKLSVIGRVASL